MTKTKQNEHKTKPLSFQDMILETSKFWANYGCSLLQSYDIEMGAGTLSPHTALKLVASQKNGTPLNSCYLQYSRRPTDARYATNPNRLSSYYQTQVILSPAPNNVQQLIIESLEKIGISSSENEIRFVEDNWENESIGAFGLGWECWLNGMEIIQVTFMKEIGGVELFPH